MPRPHSSTSLSPLMTGGLLGKVSQNLKNPHDIVRHVSYVDIFCFFCVFAVFSRRLEGNLLFLLGERIACWQGNRQAYTNLRIAGLLGYGQTLARQTPSLTRAITRHR